MIPIRSLVVSCVLVSKIEGELKMLMMKRVKGNFWCHVAGKVEQNETASQAILREVMEETQIRVQKLFNADFLEQFYDANLNVIELIPAFVGYCEDHQTVVLNHEHTEYQWCNLIEAKELAVFANQKKLYDFVWEHFVSQVPDALLEIR